MANSRIVLVVEDSQHQFISWRTQMEAAGWLVQRAQDRDSTIRELEQAQQREQPIDIVVLDLGLPPGKDDPFVTGLPLAAEIRNLFSTLPMLAYTSLPPTSFDYALTLTKLLPLRSSFIDLRSLSDQVELANLLDLVWRGFVLLSPVPADYLVEAIATTPDPLSDQHWQTLKLLSENLSQKEIANRISDLSVEGVKARIARIKEILVHSGELMSYQNQVEDIVAWYRRHHVRYYRE